MIEIFKIFSPFQRRSILVLLFVLLFVLPLVITDIYYINLLTEIIIISLLTISFNLMMGYTGMVSLGHTAYFGIGAYTGAVLLKKVTTSLLVVLPGSLLVAGFVALVLGYFCVRLVQAYFVFITLAFAQMIYTIIYYWDSLTGGDDGLPGIPRMSLKLFDVFSIDLSSPIVFYYFVLIVVILAATVCRLIVVSPFGAILQSIRENPERVEFLGININRYKLQIFVIAGAFAGLSGALYSLYQGFISPEILFWTKSAECILMTLLGGAQAFLGPALGAGLLIYLKDMILNYTESWKIILGAILIFILLFSPKGVLGTIQERLQFLRF